VNDAGGIANPFVFSTIAAALAGLGFFPYSVFLSAIFGRSSGDLPDLQETSSEAILSRQRRENLRNLLRYRTRGDY
jgi:hypothetical protein